MNARGSGVGRLVALAYILAISLPPLGLALGVALSVRFRGRYSRHGLAAIVLSIVVSVVWIVILTSGTLNKPTTGY
jgi:hypothetical protein